MSCCYAHLDDVRVRELAVKLTKKSPSIIHRRGARGAEVARARSTALLRAEGAAVQVEAKCVEQQQLLLLLLLRWHAPPQLEQC